MGDYVQPMLDNFPVKFGEDETQETTSAPCAFWFVFGIIRKRVRTDSPISAQLLSEFWLCSDTKGASTPETCGARLMRAAAPPFSRSLMLNTYSTVLLYKKFCNK